MWKKIRSFGRVVKAFIGFYYDFKRYYLYSSWNADMNDRDIRNYHMVKLYHSLEKSLSFKDRNNESGWSVAYSVLELIKLSAKNNDYGYHDKAGLTVLKRFVSTPDNSNHQHALIIKKEIQGLSFDSEDKHGVMTYEYGDFSRGRLLDPESFFFSRYSLREFDGKKVDDQVVIRAISLAMKTPSVCNRQPWHVYHTNDDDVIKKALSYQQGNKGFGDNVKNLMIVTSDLKAFMPGQEHYQHWIDGGLFSMSLVYAFHSLGIASCCLNWSQSPGNDMKLRAAFNIREDDSVIMMLAFGYPNDENKVCVSARRPLCEIYSKLEIKDELGL